jgi:hypothetical protein
MTARASFELRLTGEPADVERAATDLADRLAEAGYVFEEDFESLHGAGWAVVGLRLRTAGAVLAALDLVPHVGAYLVETHDEASRPAVN